MVFVMISNNIYKFFVEIFDIEIYMMLLNVVI